MRPCDCISQDEMNRTLTEHGLRINEKSITVRPLRVVLENGPGTLVFPMETFQSFAEWYLEDQK